MPHLEHTPLSRLAHRLLDLTGDPGPGYRKLHLLACNAAFPTVSFNGRLYVRDQDIALIAGKLGLVIPAASTRRPTAKRAALAEAGHALG